MAVIGSWWQLAMQAAACQPANAAIQTAIQACLQLGMAPRASQGLQLMPWLLLVLPMQPQPIQLPLAVQ